MYVDSSIGTVRNELMRAFDDGMQLMRLCEQIRNGMQNNMGYQQSGMPMQNNMGYQQNGMPMQNNMGYQQNGMPMQSNTVNRKFHSRLLRKMLRQLFARLADISLTAIRRNSVRSAGLP